MSRSLTRAAHAKVNLALAVGPPRGSDGFHPICSWFAPIDLADEVRVERLADEQRSRFEIRWAADAPRAVAIDWPIENDLAVRALRLLESEVGRRLPVAMTLTKRIPVGGGLGGGSSDAAAMLRAVIDLFELDISKDCLVAIALALGSDVPYFLLDPLTPAVIEGVGERLTPAPAVRGMILLILPPFGCATGAVYRAFDASPAREFRGAEVRGLALAGRLESAALFNDLAAAAEVVEPRLGEIRRRAAEIIGGPVHVTGSGSTLFVACEQGRRADLEGALREGLPLCNIVPTIFFEAATEKST